MVRESKCSANNNTNTNAAGTIKLFGVYLQNNVNEVAGNVEKNNNVQRNDVDQKKKGIYYVKKLLFVLDYRKFKKKIKICVFFFMQVKTFCQYVVH